MIHKAEMEALKERAHAARMTMPDVCRRAGIFPQSWHRAFKRGKANYTLIDPLEKAMSDIEQERESAK